MDEIARLALLKAIDLLKLLRIHLKVSVLPLRLVDNYVKDTHLTHL